jgi:hypothetical protein
MREHIFGCFMRQIRVTMAKDNGTAEIVSESRMQPVDRGARFDQSLDDVLSAARINVDHTGVGKLRIDITNAGDGR